MAFVIRKFNGERCLGDKLKEMRHVLNYTLQEMSQKTKIQKQYLQALEKGQYHQLPEPIYTRNYLKTYVRALGGDISYFVEQFEKERGTCDYLKRACFPRQKVRPIFFLLTSKYLRSSLLVLLAFLVTSYLGFQIFSLLKPPTILVFEPSDGLVTSDSVITVSGQGEEGVIVSINETTVLLKQDGSFKSDIILEEGLNVISIEGAKRYSRSATSYRRVILEKAELTESVSKLSWNQ